MGILDIAGKAVGVLAGVEATESDASLLTKGVGALEGLLGGKKGDETADQGSAATATTTTATTATTDGSSGQQQTTGT